MRKIPCRLLFFTFLLFIFAVTPLTAGTYYLLRDYYALIYGSYFQFSEGLKSHALQAGTKEDYTLPRLFLSTLSSKEPENVNNGINLEDLLKEGGIESEFNFEAEIDLDLSYGGSFSLEPGVVVGAGSEGITDGLKYDLIEKILLEGSIGDRLFVEFNYDSERSEIGIGEEKNIYSVMYKGKKDEFIKEATLGNKYLSIGDSRYIPIDEGNQDSFALRAEAGWQNLTLEGLFRYNVALDGRKKFKGFKKSVDMKALDIDYAKGNFYFIPDIDIDENTLKLYKTSDDGFDITVDNKKFSLLTRGEDFDFDNTSGTLWLREALLLEEELIVYYEKGGFAAGSSSLGKNAIIDHDGVAPDGGRVDFDAAGFPEYFDTTKTYLYLKKKAFNSYWELKNVYYLEELEGSSVYNLKIELFLTYGGGINSNYDDLLDSYDIDTGKGIIRFNFSDAGFNPDGGFYPRPFPGVEPFSSTYTPPDETKPFDPSNPIYGGINYPTSDKSINTLHITYEYYAESFFLDFDLVPGSVEVIVNGRTLEDQYYDVDYKFGIVTFKEGVINPSSDIEIIYKYTPFGGGDRDIFTALGITFENDWLKARNLTAYQTAIKGEEAPDIGSERKSTLKNSTSLSMRFGAQQEEEGVYALLDSEIAFSVTNKNLYGSAVIADMEGGEYTSLVSLNDTEWMIATKSSILPANPPYMNTRGALYYKNYWTESFIYGDALQTAAWNIPDSQVFPYEEKAGPYNTSDKPSGGEDTSLVIDYKFEQDSTNPYLTIVTPLDSENLAESERFNLMLRGDVTGSDVRLYAELLKTYDEDINKNGLLDGESSINDAGFSIIPEDGTRTVIGTDRYGNSDGKIESEDLNGNGYLDTGTEEEVLLRQSVSTDYVVSFSAGSTDWQRISIDITDLIKNNRSVFQYANALRLTVMAPNTSPSYKASGSGKIFINKLWFSGAAMTNNSRDYLTISEVSVNESSEVRSNAFSASFPGIYNNLHGSSSYRAVNEYFEAVLVCSLKTSASNPLPSGEVASVSRRFGSPMDLASYREYNQFLFLPSSQTVPSSLDFVLSFLSSSNERLDVTINGTSIQKGWNRIAVALDPPYGVKVNGSWVGEMTLTGDLLVLKRVSEIRFGFKAEGLVVTSPLEVWLDEWYVEGSRDYTDKAFFSEGTFGYNGKLLSIYDFAFIGDPSLSLGYERKEGEFSDEFDYMSDRYFGGVDARLFNYLDTSVNVSEEFVSPLREEARFPEGLSADEVYEQYNHSLKLDFGNQYLPVLTHSYDRHVTKMKDIELTESSYRYKGTDEYDETITVGEQINLPFGLSQSYLLTRSWLYENASIGYPESGFIPNVQQSADLNQTSDILVSYSWDTGSTQLGFTRDLVFTGSYALFSENLFDAYTYKLGSLFSPPSDLLKDSSPSLKADSYFIDVNVPLRERVGFSLAFSTGFNESNFYLQNGYRDTLAISSLYLSVPFHPFDDNLIEIRPSMERKIQGEYKKVFFSASEENILLNGYRYLFAPPFYYINPFEFLGIGRVKDYEAVNLYRDSDELVGNTINTLSNTYSLETLIGYDPWYIPSRVLISFGGETRREGANYTQKRSTELSVGRYIWLEESDLFFDRSLDIGLDYRNEIDYATKVVNNTFGVTYELHFLESDSRGVRISQSASYGAERQRIGDPDLYLYPGDASHELQVSEMPDKDTINNEIEFAYLWEFDIRQSFLYSLLGGTEDLIGTVKNEESIKMENIYTFTDREKAGSFSNIPIRCTLQHTSSYNITENVIFDFDFKTVVGIEEKIIPPSVTGNILPSMGIEFGVKLKILF